MLFSNKYGGRSANWAGVLHAALYRHCTLSDVFPLTQFFSVGWIASAFNNRHRTALAWRTNREFSEARAGYLRRQLEREAQEDGST